MNHFDQKRFKSTHIGRRGSEFVSSKYMAKDGIEVETKIWDCRDQSVDKNPFDVIRPYDGILVQFDVDDTTQFEITCQWLRSICYYKVDNQSVIFVGTRSRLDRDQYR